MVSCADGVDRYALPADGAEPTRFEVMQRLAEPPLTEHPETGEPVRRVLTAR